MNRTKRKNRTSTIPTVTLLTDFGLQDEYVGVMKGVILKYAPVARLIDISHLVPPQDVRAASHLLGRTFPYFPTGTVHLVVIDPGVGSSRAILALSADGHHFVGPDNGVFTSVFARSSSLTVHRVTAAHLFLDRIGATFHGRDIMAPIAARLSAGLALDQVGPRIPAEECVRFADIRPHRKGEMLQGEVVYIDRFGNLCTNISRSDVEIFTGGMEFSVEIAEAVVIPVCQTYAEQEIGKPIALYDSHDHLEIAVNQGSAAQLLRMSVGTHIRLKLR